MSTTWEHAATSASARPSRSSLTSPDDPSPPATTRTDPRRRGPARPRRAVGRFTADDGSTTRDHDRVGVEAEQRQRDGDPAEGDEHRQVQDDPASRRAEDRQRCAGTSSGMGPSARLPGRAGSRGDRQDEAADDERQVTKLSGSIPPSRRDARGARGYRSRRRQQDGQRAEEPAPSVEKRRAFLGCLGRQLRVGQRADGAARQRFSGRLPGPGSARLCPGRPRRRARRRRSRPRWQPRSSAG